MVLQQLRFSASQGIPFLFMSGEQTARQCIWQLHSQHLSFEASQIRDGKIPEESFDAMVEDAQALQDMPFLIQEWSGLTVGKIRARCQPFFRRHGPGIIAIDHAKLIIPRDRGDILAERVAQVYSDLKSMAKQLGCAVIILMQRNSQFLHRGVMRPVRADCYGGEGALQSLDACLAIFRAEKWLKEKIRIAESQNIENTLTEKLEKEIGRADLYALKVRFGEEGRQARLRFKAQFTKFESLREDTGDAFGF